VSVDEAWRSIPSERDRSERPAGTDLQRLLPEGGRTPPAGQPELLMSALPPAAPEPARLFVGPDGPVGAGPSAGMQIARVHFPRERRARAAPEPPGRIGTWNAAVLGQAPVGGDLPPGVTPPATPPGPFPGAGPPPPPAGAAPPPPPPGAGPTVDLSALDAKGVTIQGLVKLLSDQLGLNFYIDDLNQLSQPIGAIIGPKQVSKADAELLLRAILEFRGFGMEGVGRYRRIVSGVKGDVRNRLPPFAAFRREPPRDGSAPLDGASLDTMVIQMFKLRHVPVNELQAIIQKVTGSQLSMITYQQANLMFIADNEHTLRRIAQIIAELDVPGPTRKLTIVKVNNGQAKEVSDKVTQILQKRSEGEVDPGTRDSKASKPALLVDERTNSILLISPEEDVKFLVGLIEDLDRSGIVTPHIKVVHLQFTEAEPIANQVNQAFKVGGATASPSLQYVVIADARTQSLILSAVSAEMLRRVEELIQFLDNPAAVEGGINVHHYRMKYGDAAKVEKILSALESGASAGAGAAGQQRAAAATKILADDGSNSLVIAASPSRYQDILQLLKKLDTLRPQVLVEALIVQVSTAMLDQLGADFNLLPPVSSTSGDSRPFGLGRSGAITNLFSPTAGGLSVGVIAPGTFDVNSAATGNVGERSKIQYLINLFKSDNRSNIIQAPRITAADNSTAKLTVGAKVQVPSGISPTTVPGQIPVISFTTEELGLTMEITPRITEGDFVSLKFKAELKDRLLGAEGTISFGPFQSPVFTKTAVENEVLVRDRDTLVIGGLLTEDKSKQLSKIPFVGDLPIIGRLFQSRNRSSTKRDLLVFMTPHISRNAFDARRITDAEARPLQWRDLPGHTWPHERGLPITPPQIQQDLKRSGLPFRKLYRKPPKIQDAFRR
jgi:general secretion pathway protein D